MNKWTQKSKELAKKPGYLDRLSEIYVMNVNQEREITPELEKDIREAFEKKNTVRLINLLLSPDVFPVKDSYVGFLRLRPEAIKENPLTTKRIGKRLYGLGIDALIKEAKRPKETNRQLGHSFKNWLRTIGVPVLSREEFDVATGTVILAGSDKALATYAREQLGCALAKGIDLVLKKDGRFLIGEAKFLTTPGGEQNGSFADASNFISQQKVKNVTRIALLDGYIWLESTAGLHNKIISNDLDIFSALLLQKYIEEF